MHAHLSTLNEIIQVKIISNAQQLHAILPNLNNRAEVGLIEFEKIN